MLALDDPLWKKLDDAHRDRDIPGLLSELATSWDDEAASSLFWDCLCHQGTCYGATYAAIPHLLRIAEPDENRKQRLAIAIFTGFVAHRALPPRRQLNDQDDLTLQGLPEHPEEWDRKLDCYRKLVATLEDPSSYRSPYEREVLLPRYRKVLLNGAVNGRDIDIIKAIRRDFLSSLPTISAICERAFIENLQNEGALLPLLGGVAAAEGYSDLGGLLYSGREGTLTCAHCNAPYSYVLFGNRIALYAHRGSPPIADMAADSPLLLDFKDGASTRADCFISPAREDESFGALATRLLLLASRAQNPQPALVLRSFLGSFHCRRCGTNAPIHAM